MPCEYFDAATAKRVREMYAVDFELFRHSYSVALPVLKNGTCTGLMHPRGGDIISKEDPDEDLDYSPPEDVDDDDIGDGAEARMSAHNELEFHDDYQ